MEKLKEYLVKKWGFDKAEFMYSLSKHKNENFSKDMRKVYNEKYPHRKGRLLGADSKAIPDSIFKKVINYFSKVDDELALIYEIEGLEGPRIGDLVEIKIRDIDFVKHKIKIYNHKESRFYEVPLYPEVEIHLKKFISKHEKEINLHKGFIFFTRDDEHHPNRKEEHLTQQFINRKLVAFLEDQGLNKIYAIRSNDGGKLHLYTTHSNRGHAGTKIKNKTGKIEMAAKLLDHSPLSLSTTELYIERSNEDLENVIRKK